MENTGAFSRHLGRVSVKCNHFFFFWYLINEVRLLSRLYIPADLRIKDQAWVGKDELNILRVSLAQTCSNSCDIFGGAVSNPVLGLFHHRCFENKPLEPGLAFWKINYSLKRLLFSTVRLSDKPFKFYFLGASHFKVPDDDASFWAICSLHQQWMFRVVTRINHVTTNGWGILQAILC